MNNKNNINVYAVIVTYNPDLNTLEKLLRSLITQVSVTIVVDNGSENSARLKEYCDALEDVSLYPLDSNKGIAAAQNRGIEVSISQGAEYILLSDQDSLPALNMVESLLENAIKLRDKGVRFAAIGPRYLDERQNNPPPFIRVEKLRIKRQYEPEYNSTVEVDYLIASGCLIPASVLKAVGNMKEDMFIDYVDIEWGLRAKSFGYLSYGDFNANMTHSLGDNPVSFLGKSYPIHSPLRHYYMTRNAVWLYKQKYIPWNWKFVDGYRLVLRIGFYILHAKPRWKHTAMMMKGIYHGAISKMGKL